MFRNLLATVGGLFLLGYFKPAIGQKVPIINSLPIPSVTINWAGGSKPTNKPGENTTASTPQNSPSPSPSVTPKPKRWGIHFEMKSNIGDQSDK
jgi:hypothetical protein